MLADFTDEDGALAEQEDLDDVASLLLIKSMEEEEKKLNPPIGKIPLDNESTEKLSKFYSGEENGLDDLTPHEFTEVMLQSVH